MSPNTLKFSLFLLLPSVVFVLLSLLFSSFSLFSPPVFFGFVCLKKEEIIKQRHGNKETKEYFKVFGGH